MSQIDDLRAAVAAARTEMEADKQAILAEIVRLGLPDEDVSDLITAVGEFGTALDDVPGVTPATPPPPPVEPTPEPTPEPGPDEPLGRGTRGR